ncbi:MAG: hypothetical protein QM608_18455 [Caulobacter sp.]
MRWSPSKLPLLALPILVGQFLWDVTDDGFDAAAHHFPMRLLVMGALVAVICLAGWAIGRRKRRLR